MTQDSATPEPRILTNQGEMVRLLDVMLKANGTELPKHDALSMLIHISECIVDLTKAVMQQNDSLFELRHIAQHGVIVDAPCDVTDCEYRARPRRLDA